MAQKPNSSRSRHNAHARLTNSYWRSRTTRNYALLSWALWSLTFALILAGTLLYLASKSSWFDEEILLLLILAAGNLTMATVGALVVSRQPRNLIGWIFCMMALAIAISGITEDYAEYSFTHQSLPATTWILWVSSWVATPIVIMGISFWLLLFPSGRLLSPRWRWIAWLNAAVIATSVLRGAIGTETVSDDPAVQNPVDIPAVVHFFNWSGAFLLFLAPTAIMFISLLSLIIRFRRSTGVERQQMKWFTYAVVMLVAAVVLAASAAALDPDDQGGWIGAVGWITTLLIAMIGIPVSVGIAILRYNLYDIDRLINRTLVYATLTASLLATYLGISVVLGGVTRAITGQTSDLVIAASTLAVAALFRPVRRRIQRTVDRRFYRQKYDARQVLQAFSVTAREAVQLDQLTSSLTDVVATTVQPAHVSIWLPIDPKRKT